MNDIENALRRFATAHKIASENPSLLVEARKKGAEEYQRVSDLCSQRMEECSKAEMELMAFADSPEASEALKEFAAADADPGCSTCWFSSKKGEHPDCDVKIDRWFKARDALVASSELASCIKSAIPSWEKENSHD